MDGEISFDTFFSEEKGVHNIEGCYRLPGQDWQIFYFAHQHKGQSWSGPPQIRKDVVWPSGIHGVDVVYPAAQILNRGTVKKVLSDVLGVDNWLEVHGPDSLQMK